MKVRRVYVAAAVRDGPGRRRLRATTPTPTPPRRPALRLGQLQHRLRQKDDALAGQVDGKISSDGKLVVGTDPTYEPSEFKQGGKIVGFDVDLGNAIAKKLGLTAEFQEVEVRQRSSRRSGQQVQDRHVLLHRQHGARADRRLRHLLHGRHQWAAPDRQELRPGRRLRQEGRRADRHQRRRPRTCRPKQQGRARSGQAGDPRSCKFDSQDAATNCRGARPGRRGGRRLPGHRRTRSSRPTASWSWPARSTTPRRTGSRSPRTPDALEDGGPEGGQVADRRRHVQADPGQVGGRRGRDHRRRINGATELSRSDRDPVRQPARTGDGPRPSRRCRVRHPGRWVGAAVLAVLVAMFVNGAGRTTPPTTGARSASTSSTSGCPRPRWSRSS